MSGIQDTTGGSPPSEPKGKAFEELEGIPLYGGSIEDYKKFSAAKATPEQKVTVKDFLPPRPRETPIQWARLKLEEAQRFLELFRKRASLFEEGKSLDKAEHREFLLLCNRVVIYERQEDTPEKKEKRRLAREAKKKRKKEKEDASDEEEEDDQEDDRSRKVVQPQQFVPFPVPNNVPTSGFNVYFVTAPVQQ